MFRFKLGVVFLVVLTVLLDGAHATGFKGRNPIKAPDNFMEWCEADELFKPYVKYYYGGRLEALKKAKPDVEKGPGHHYDFLSQKNTYVCINGLAWMYYAKIQSGKIPVLVQPELHIYEHNCMLTNFEDGPGRTEPWANDSIPIPMLYSILLMGDGTDYRKPSIELISAPTAGLIWNTTASKMEYQSPLQYVNGTSLVMIGDETECILQKGQGTIRVRSDTPISPDHLPDPAKPEEKPKYGGTFCKFSYSTLSGPTLKDANLVSAPKTDATEKEVTFAAEVLQNSWAMSKTGCFVPDNYTNSTWETVLAREKMLQQLSANLTTTVLQKPSDVLEKVYAWKATAGTTMEEKVQGELILLIKPDLCKGPLAGVKLEIVACTLADQTLCPKPPADIPACPDPNKVPEKAECDPCNQADPGVQAIIKGHLANIVVHKAANKPDEIEKANTEIIKAKLQGCLAKIHDLTKQLGGVTSPGPPVVGDGDYGDTLKAWETTATTGAMAVLRDYLDLAPVAPATEVDPATSFAKKQAAAAAISKGEAARKNLEILLELTTKEYKEFVRNVATAVAGGVPNCGMKKKGSSDHGGSIPKSGVITIKRDAKAEDYIQTNNQSGKDPTAYPPDTTKTCGKLPATPVSCKNAKPGEKRACQLLNARMGIYTSTPPASTTGRKKRQAIPEGWAAGDEWREGILSTIADIFSKACGPMVKEVFANDINKVIKGYLINYVEGTLKNETVEGPDVACCAAEKDKCYAIAAGDATKNTACDTAETTCKDPANTSPPPACPHIMEECDEGNPAHAAKLAGTPPACPVAPLPIRRQYWDQLTGALKDCKAHERVLQFKRIFKDDDRDQPDDAFVYKLMGKPWKELVVEDNIEQADAEYAFNYVIDSLWRMFATTMALCMPYIEKPLPDVTRQYYALFTEDFLYPLAKEWRNNRDNPVFELILGAYYEKRTDYWVKKCMEAAFMRTGDIRWRPPRKLLVNGLSEMNYFIQGPVHKLTLPKGFYYK